MVNNSDISMKPMSKEDLENLKKLLKDGGTQPVSQNAPMDPEELKELKDSFLKAQYRQIMEQELTGKKPGRNDPCPCGSGKKYKKCCLQKHEEIRKTISPEILQQLRTEKEKKEQIKSRIEEGFGFLASGEYKKAHELAEKLLQEYPDDDRLYDIKVNAKMHLGRFTEAIRICRSRLEVARAEKAFYLEHGYHREQEPGDDGGGSHFYSPISWLEKYWIALKALTFDAQCPGNGNEKIKTLVKKLREANNVKKFPQRGDEGLRIRRKELEPVIKELQGMGPDTIPYILPLTTDFSWASLFVPEILAAYPVEDAWRSMMEIAMFGHSYVTAACLNYLRTRKEALLPLFQEFFVKDSEFDPLKTGLIRLLGEIKNRRAYDLLTSLMEHDDPYVVRAASVSLANQGFPEALQVLEKTEKRVGLIPEMRKAIEDLKTEAKSASSEKP